MRLLAAPLQGVTDCAWRHFHSFHYPESLDCYLTPFVRMEKGEPRGRDMRDVCSELNTGVATVTQIIFSGPVEFGTLTEALVKEGIRRIDLNIGCPFPLQVKRGRGAGMTERIEVLAAVRREMEQWIGDVEFSAKMRTGVNDSSRWEDLMDEVEKMPLQWVTIHPRTARQQYGGEPDLDLFGRMAAATHHKVVYNGDVRTPADFRAIMQRFPQIDGVMIGRGLCGRPSLAAEIESGREWTAEERLQRVMALHTDMRSYYERTMCGEAQIVGKLQAMWEYAESEIGRKAWKAIRKANGLRGYDKAISLIGRG